MLLCEKIILNSLAFQNKFVFRKISSNDSVEQSIDTSNPIEPVESIDSKEALSPGSIKSSNCLKHQNHG